MGEYHKVFITAAKMGISARPAANMRIRYLVKEVHFMSKRRPLHPVVALWINRALDEILWLHLELARKEDPTKRFVRKDRITDEDIAVAKDSLVTDLIQFQRGKALAWCHEDKNPSLYYASRINRAVCPVCDRKFNAIDILIFRDGYSFKDAVKELR